MITLNHFKLYLGCSSMVGMIEELGPFHVADNGNTVYLNPYTWNKVK